MAELNLPRVNYVILSGRLTDDPEMNLTTKGTPVTRFRIACSRPYKDTATGEWKEDTLFIPVKTFRELAERCNKRLSKGNPVFVEGRLNQRNWETPEGQKRSVLKVIGFRVQFLEKMPSTVEKEEFDEGIVEESPEEDLPF